ncbi:DNA polymerase alpha/epsilon-like protein [Ordospora colligata]|nr:DNA polymerase alpha/epsilon-like protein [Ordospora colligata]
MKAKIYKELTKKNGILLSSDALAYLNTKITDECMLMHISTEYKRRNGPNMGDLRLFQEIIESTKAYTQTPYTIINQQYRKTDLMHRYKRLKQRINKDITPIYLLSNRRCTIFGCYYRDKQGKEVLEDDGDIIILDMNMCNGNAFLCDNIFVALDGCVTKNAFEVTEIHFPSIEMRNTNMHRIPVESFKMLFFSDLWLNEMNGNILRKIIMKIPADLIVIMGRLSSEKCMSIPYACFMNGLKPNNAFSQVPDIIICPEANDLYSSFLPKEVPSPSEYKDTIKMATNPCIIETKYSSVGIVRDNVFKSRERGRFIGTDYTNSFIRTMLSQQSFNPFVIPNLDIEGIPDIVVVGQDVYPFISCIDDITFISCPSFRDGMSFISYDASSRIPSILCCKDVLEDNA